jgi:hypothetical protein
MTVNDMTDADDDSSTKYMFLLWRVPFSTRLNTRVRLHMHTSYTHARVR